MRELIENIIMPAFDNEMLRKLHDGAVVSLGDSRLAFATDSYVIRPLFFPGGDIGSLAVHGTVNDLAMCGARPAFLSTGLIVEEGLALETLDRIVRSMRVAADACQVMLVTGDTKVVNRGQCDGIYINTAGIGSLAPHVDIEPAKVRPGDSILLSGDIGRHGVAVMAAREELGFESSLTSDSAPLAAPVLGLIDRGIPIHCLRDLTRGGLGAALVEIASSGKLKIHVEEKAIPVREEVRAACEILGLDPLYMANEGRFIAFVPEDRTEEALKVLADYPVSREACRIGVVGGAREGAVEMATCVGAVRPVEMPSGEQLPRIC